MDPDPDAVHGARREQACAGLLFLSGLPMPRCSSHSRVSHGADRGRTELPLPPRRPCAPSMATGASGSRQSAPSAGCVALVGGLGVGEAAAHGGGARRWGCLSLKLQRAYGIDWVRHGQLLACAACDVFVAAATSARLASSLRLPQMHNSSMGDGGAGQLLPPPAPLPCATAGRERRQRRGSRTARRGGEWRRAGEREMALWRSSCFSGMVAVLPSTTGGASLDRGGVRAVHAPARDVFDEITRRERRKGKGWVATWHGGTHEKGMRCSKPPDSSKPKLKATMADDGTSITHRTVELSTGLRMHMAEAGPAGVHVVLLLHGFPETWYTWRH
ncbi:hypothetical protein EJB05_34596, partial [Eragrostis curvula]